MYIHIMVEYDSNIILTKQIIRVIMNCIKKDYIVIYRREYDIDNI